MKSIAKLGLVALTAGLMAASPALSKGHDQGGGNGENPAFDGIPGSMAVAETATAAKTLGPAKGASSTAPGKTK